MSKRKVLYDASNPDHIRSAEDAENDREKDLVFILSQPRGRRWLYDLIYNKAHVEFISHVPGDSDSTAFNEGARSVGKVLLDEVVANQPKLFIKMLEENLND